MADDSTVEVKITGSVDPSLSAATAQAKTVMDGAGNSVQVSAKAMSDALKAVGGDASKITPEMLGMASAVSSSGAAMASSLGQVSSAVTAVGNSTKAMATGMNVATQAVNRNRIAMGQATAAYEATVIVHELLMKRFSRTPASLMILTQYLTRGSMAMTGFAISTMAVVGVLGFLIYKSYEADKQNRSLAEGFQLIGNTALTTKENVAAEKDLISDLPGATESAAAGFLKLAAAHADWDNGLRNSVQQLMPKFGSTAEEQDKAAGKLMESLSDLTESGFKKLDREMLALQPVQAEHIQNLIKTGQTAEAVNEILQELASRTGTYMNTIGEQHYAARIKVEQLKYQIDTLKGTLSTTSPQMLAGLIEQLGKAKQDLKEIEDEARTFGLQLQQNQSKGAIEVLDQANVSLNKSVQRQQELGKLASAQNVLEKNLSDLQAQRNPKNAKEIAFLQEKIALGTQDIAQQKQAYAAEDAAAAKRAARSAAHDESEKWQTYVASERAKVQATQEGSQERLAIERQWESEAARIYGRNSKQYSEAKAAISETERRSADLQLSIMKENASSEVSILRTQREQKKSELDAEVADNQISKQQEISVLAANDDRIIDIEESTAQAEIDSIRKVTEARLNQNLGRAPTQTETSSALSEIPAYVEANNRIKQLEADRIADHAKAAAEMADADKHAAEEGARGWRTAVNEIKGAEDTLNSDLFSGRKTLGQSLVNMSLQFAQREVAADAAGMTNRLLLSKEELAADKSAGQMGVLYHLLFEQEKTAGTKVGSLTRATTERTTEESGVISRFGTWLAEWLGLESGKTAATTTASAARMSTEITAQSTSAATTASISAASHLELVAAYAGEAFAAAYQSAAAIPFVGWMIAPAAATEAMATVLSVGAFASGTDYAPGGMALVGERGPEIVNIPRGAQVIPNHKIANAISSSSVSSSSTSNSSVANLTYSPTINAPGNASLEDMLSKESKTMLKWISARQRDGSLSLAKAA